MFTGVSIVTMQIMLRSPARSTRRSMRRAGLGAAHQRLNASQMRRQFWGKMHYLRDTAVRTKERAFSRVAHVVRAGAVATPRARGVVGGGSGDTALSVALSPLFDAARIHLFVGSHRSTISMNVSTFTRAVEAYGLAHPRDGAKPAPVTARASARAARRERHAAAALEGVKKMMALAGGSSKRTVAQWDVSSAMRGGGRSSRALDPNVAPLLVFIHVPKAGGSTVKVLLRDWASASLRTIAGNAVDFLSMTLAEQNAQSAAWGHRGFGLHRQGDFHNKRRAVAYFTVLREPRARIVSQYHFALQRKAEVEKSRSWAPPDPTFASWFAAERSMSPEDPWHPSDNPNVRQICCWWTPFARGSRRAHEDCAPSQDTLECAKRNLERFAVVGVVEHMDDVVELLARRLGVADNRCPEDTAVNTFRGGAKHVLSAVELEIVANATRYDSQLYAFGSAIFQRQLAVARRARVSAVTAAPTASSQHYWGHEATLRREAYRRNYAQFVDSAACVAYDGLLHRWRVHSGTVGDIHLQLYRPVDDEGDGGGGFTLVHTSVYTIAGPGAHTFGTDAPPTTVRRGDCIGWYAPVGGMLRYDFPPSGAGGCKTLGVSDNVRTAPIVGSVFHPTRFVRWHVSVQAFVVPSTATLPESDRLFAQATART